MANLFIYWLDEYTIEYFIFGFRAFLLTCVEGKSSDVKSRRNDLSEKSKQLAYQWLRQVMD